MKSPHSEGSYAEMRTVAFIERYQTEVIEKILHHCGLSGRSNQHAPCPPQSSRLQAEPQDEENVSRGGGVRGAGHPLEGKLSLPRPGHFPIPSVETRWAILLEAAAT